MNCRLSCIYRHRPYTMDVARAEISMLYADRHTELSCADCRHASVTTALKCGERDLQLSALLIITNLLMSLCDRNFENQTTFGDIINKNTVVSCWKMNKYVSGEWPISTHADPTSTRRAIFDERRISIGRIGQRAGLADSSDSGLLVEQNVRFRDLDAVEPPCKIWRR